MKGHGKTMGLISDLVDQMQDRRMALQDDRLIFLAEDVEDFFFLGDARERLIDDLQRVKGLRGGMELPDSTINQNQARQRFLLLLQPAVAARYGFAHAGEVIVLSARAVAAFFAANDEFAVVRLFHSAFFPDHHRSDRIASLDVRNVKALNAVRFLRQIERILQRLADGLCCRLQHAEALLEGMLRVVLDEIQKCALLPALRRVDLHLVPGALGQRFFQKLAVFEFHWHMNRLGQVFGFQVKLFEQRGHKFLRIEFLELFPVEFATVHDAPAAQVEQVGRNKRRLRVVRQDVGVVALCRSNALALFDVLERSKQIAISGGLFEQLFLRGGHHALLEAFHEVVTPAFQKEPDVARGFRVAFVGGESRDARAEATLDVILQAGTRVSARKVHGAGRNQKPLVHEVKDAARQARGEIRAEVERAVFFYPPREVYARKFFRGGEFDVGVGFVVAKNDVELRAILLDKIVFESQGLALIADENGLEVGDLADK